MKYVKSVILVLFILFVIIVAVENISSMSTTVQFRLDLVFWQYTSPAMSVYLVAIITFLLGLIVGGLLGISERFRLKRHIKGLKREAARKDEELNSLRNLPVTAEGMGPDKAPEV